VSGINYAVANGARVINMSLGGAAYSQAMHDAIAAAPNVLFVVAAGNSGNNLDSSPFYPCSYALANMICVGASNANDHPAWFSNWGPNVDIAAPGVNVLSTYALHTVFFDNVENGAVIGPWTRGGTPNTWTWTNEAYASPTRSLTDSPNAPPASN